MKKEFRVGMHIGSGRIGDSDTSGHCYLNVHAGPLCVDLWLPRVLWPIREKVVARWDAATVARMGRDYYVVETERRYGWYIFGNHFVIYLGRVTDDSSTEQKWSCFLPFADWRFARHTLYNSDGSIAWEDIGQRTSWDQMHAAEDRIEKQVFRFRDFDGEEIEARTHVEEREWHFGTKSFRWLSWFRRPRIRRSMDIKFSKEVGREKGSWKGGTVGHSIDIEPNESQFSAFGRYCGKHGLTHMLPAA